MSSVFSKNKEKRSRTSSDESNNSFVKNVTSRVSGLLPATITKWFSSPSSTNTNGSAPTADATDSSTEDEAPESPITTQPPAKRMRYSPGTAHYGYSENNCVTTNIETIETSTPYNTVQSPPGRTTFRRETNFVSTPLRSNEDTVERSEKESTTMFLPQHSVLSIAPSSSKKRKSLFGNESQALAEATKRACVKSSCNTVRDPKLPSFKPTLLGSPFYAGRTTYGGAASSYINQPNIQQRQNTTVKEVANTSDNNISHSARRVMELLEHYSSPLMEAKRIPQYVRPTRQELINRSLEASSSSNKTTNSYKTQELHVPSIASILRLKQRSRLNDTTNAARQIIASHSSTSADYLPYPSSSAKRDQSEADGKLTTKVKSRLTRPMRGESNSLETETITPVELPNATLQIDPNNLPNFGSPIVSKPLNSIDKPFNRPPISTTFETPVKPVESTRKPEKTSISSYNFANPVKVSSNSPQTTSTPPKFTFGSPERSIDKPLVPEKKNPEPSPVVSLSKVTESKTEPAASKDWKCPDCWVSNKPDADKCVCCGCKQVSKTTSKPAKCSVCKLADSQPNIDKCVNCEKVQVNNISKPLLKTDSSKWKCEDCWVSNEAAAEKCVCCGSKNPSQSVVSKVGTNKKPEGGGMCPKCFAVTSSEGKCRACNGDQSVPNKPIDNTFKVVIKSQADKWECSHCLVRNDNDKTKCVCCEAERSGKPKELAAKPFNFGTINTTFKFGIDPKVQEANLAAAESKPVEKEKLSQESETNNNVVPTFTFGLPAKKSENKIDSAKEKTTENPKPAFTFGIPKENSVTATPSFGIPNKLVDNSLKETALEKEKAAESKNSASASLSIPSTGTPLQDKLSPAQPLLNSSLNSEKKDTPINQISFAAPASAVSPVSTPAATPLTSSVSGDKPTTNLFGSLSATTAATTATGISFASPVQATPAITESMFKKSDDNTPKSLSSLFQKNDAATTSTVSLFQKSEPIATTAAPPSVAATAPMFSFGATQSAQPQADKPKFNFTFGSGAKTEVPAFKPTFGASNDASTGVKQFGIGDPLANTNPLTGANGPSGNSITGNALTGGLPTANALGVTNPLSPGNGLQQGAGLPAAPSGIFGATVQKENMWSPNNSANSSNLFVANSMTNNTPKPAFTFGSSTPFNANSAGTFGASNAQPAPAFGSPAQPSTPAFGNVVNQAPTPAFGAPAQPAPAPAFGGAAQPSATPTFGSGAQPAAAPAFGAGALPPSTPAFGAGALTTSTPAFGSNAATPNIFGMPNQNANSQPSMFSNPVANQGAPGMFGAPQGAAGGMFGRPSVGAAPTFGTPNPSIPTFEAPSLTPAQAPAFNFGSPQTTGIFGFGQQQPGQGVVGAGQTGVYNFGAAAGGPQFSMGAPGPGVRRVRKAVRRTTPR